jgi:hypothetical protein
MTNAIDMKVKSTNFYHFKRTTSKMRIYETTPGIGRKDYSGYFSVSRNGNTGNYAH